MDTVRAPMSKANEAREEENSAARYDRDKLEEGPEEVVMELSDGDRIRVVTDGGQTLVGEICGESDMYERDYEGDDRAVIREVEWDVDASSVDMDVRDGEIEVVNESCPLATYRFGGSEMSGMVIRRGSSHTVEVLEVIGDE